MSTATRQHGKVYINGEYGGTGACDLGIIELDADSGTATFTSLGYSLPPGLDSLASPQLTLD